MKKIIECIPNFSEGRDENVMKQIVTAIKSVPGVIFLDQESDPDHNRSVVSFAGSPEAVMEGAFQGCKKAAELIDLNKHEGEHPRMGATDVIPLVPISGVKMAECVEYAKQLGERIGTELEIPVYLYEKAATRPERENLANVRRGQYEGIKEEIAKEDSRIPDYGPRKLGPAGASGVSAREPLVAYNVNLATDNLEIASKIAKSVRAKNGGFGFVKALGFRLEDKGIVQVSMNLTNYKKSAVHHVYEMIKREAEQYGVNVLESEIIGLIPEEALFSAAQYYLRAHNFKKKQILERRIRKKSAKTEFSLEGFLDETASKSPAPGGGSVSALAGSLSAALASMVANLTIARKKYEDVHTEMAEVLTKTEAARKTLFTLIQKDTDSYKKVIKAYKAQDDNKIQEALKGAAGVPLEIAETATELIAPLQTLCEKGNPNAITDCGVALYLIETAVKGAVLNVKINLKEINDSGFKQEMETKCSQLLDKIATAGEEIEKVVQTKL